MSRLRAQSTPNRLKLVAIALLVLGIIASPRFALGHGEGEEITSVIDGPFQIGVRLLPERPIVGLIHVSVSVRDAEIRQPVDGATVEVSAMSQDSGTRLLSPALNAPSQPLYYDANLEIDKAGVWVFRVEVQSDAGQGAVQFELSVAERSRGGSNLLPGSVLFAVVFLAIIGGATWIWYSSRRARRSKLCRAGR